MSVGGIARVRTISMAHPGSRVSRKGGPGRFVRRRADSCTPVSIGARFSRFGILCAGVVAMIEQRRRRRGLATGLTA